MAVSTDIFRSWRRPRAVIREILSQGPREDRAIAFVYAACILIFIAQWPVYARQNAGFDVPVGTEDFAVSTRMTYGAFAWLFWAPLILYAVAAVSRLIAGLIGGGGTHYGARIALFWAFLASAPVLLLHGLTMGFIGPGPQANLVGAVWFGLFGWIWSQGLAVAERETVYAG